ncbi:predicted protein [Histoplasma capsulatum var. duboisii H88]|uniref:Predicted protein n=2 Tax=Ajellomyces capsulatus TaxID=5037 RepID=F0UT52_AJEC8|nr:predicted protein [Histoplasma capsulatum H143]EGC49079.1 predicted protein [Histoplasma capsulatum var. duboisii H88]
MELTEITGLLTLMFVFLQHPLLLVRVQRLCPWLWPQSGSGADPEDMRNAAVRREGETRVLEEVAPRPQQCSNSALPNTQSPLSPTTTAAVAPSGSQSAQHEGPAVPFGAANADEN